MNRKAVLVFVLTIAIFISCKGGTQYSVTAYNDFDTPDLKIIEENNQKIFKSLKENKPEIMNDMFIEEAKSKDNTINKLYDNYSKLFILDKLKLFIIIHTVIFKDSDNSYVVAPEKYTNLFLLKIPAKYKNSIITFYTFKHNDGENLLSIVYVLNKNKWSLYSFRIGYLRLYNDTAVDIYNRAKKMHEKKHKYISFLWMSKIDKLLRPSPFCFYDEDVKIIDFKNNLLNEIKKNSLFPFTLESIKSKPTIYSIESVFVKKSLIPVIKYRSNLYLRSQKMLNKEAEMITAVIEKKIPGITKYQDNLLFQIFPDLSIKDKYNKTKAAYTVIK